MSSTYTADPVSTTAADPAGTSSSGAVTSAPSEEKLRNGVHENGEASAGSLDAVGPLPSGPVVPPAPSSTVSPVVVSSGAVAAASVPWVAWPTVSSGTPYRDST